MHSNWAYHLILRQIHPVFHVSPTTESKITGRIPTPPPPIEIHSEDEYEVAKILDNHFWRKQLEYLIEWKGYESTAKATSWEPSGHVTNVTCKITEFHKGDPTKPSPP